MDLLMKLVFSVGKRTVVLELALAEKLPVFAHFRLVLHLVLPDEVVTFLFRLEDLLRSLHSCLFIEFIRSRGAGHLFFMLVRGVFPLFSRPLVFLFMSLVRRVLVVSIA